MSYEQQQNIIEEGLPIVNRMQHLIDSMIYLSMGSGETPSSKFSIVDFNNLYEHVSLNTILLLRNKDVILERHLPSVYPQIIGNEERLEMVFTTLIENACLNSPVGGKIILEGNVADGFFEIRVIDFGSDLDESSLPYLFQSITFVGSGHFHSNNLEGAESGLYIAKIIIQEHNGFVSGARNPQGGSIFIVKLPVASDEEIKEHFAQKTSQDPSPVPQPGDRLPVEELLKRPIDTVSSDSLYSDDDGSEDSDDETKGVKTVCQKIISTLHPQSKEDFK